MLLGSLDQLIHHGREAGQSYLTGLARVVVSEQLQHKPVELSVLRPPNVSDGGLDKGFVLLHSPMVNDGMRVKGGGLGHDVLQRKFKPLIEGDDTSGLHTQYSVSYLTG